MKDKALSLLTHEADDFEARRQERETKNEKIINSILGVCLAAALAIHVVDYFTADRPPGTADPFMLVFLAFGVVVSICLVTYLGSGPPYYRIRKYATTIFGVVMNFPAMVFLSSTIPASAVSFVPISTYVLLVVVSGLRLDGYVVVLAGFLGLVSHLLFLALVVPAGPYTVPSALTACVIIGAVTACVTYVVSSILRLHRESVQKDRLARFLAPEVVEEIVNNPRIVLGEPETRVATVLFADIRGFTSLSEEIPANEVGRILNIFLEEMTSAIMARKGMVDKYIGDAVMGVFGVPVASADHAGQALEAAMDMQRRLARVNEKLAARLPAPLSIGIGIHTGEVIAGAIGSTRRLEYTVIGDTVNVASRIESLTKKLKVGILVSGETRTSLNGAIPLREVGMETLRGRSRPVTLWAPE